MSQDLEIDNLKVFTVYSWFQAEMRKSKRKISFPKCADKTKTYQFRWTKTFVDKCYNDFELDDRTVKVLISNIVSYAKRQNILRKGTQLLCMNNIIDICVQSIRDIAEDEASLISELRSCTMFLDSQVTNKNNLVRRLVEPVSTGGCSNFVYWYNLGHLTEVYVALSKSCNKALTKLPLDERAELPTQFELYRLCSQLVSPDMIDKLKPILGSDLRMPPTLIN